MNREDKIKIFLKSKDHNDFVRKVWESDPEDLVQTLARDFNRFLKMGFLPKPVEEPKIDEEYNFEMFNLSEILAISDLIKYNRKIGNKLTNTDIRKYVTRDNLKIEKFFEENRGK